MAEVTSKDQQLLVLVLGGGAFAAGLLLLLSKTGRPPGSKPSPCAPLGDIMNKGYISVQDANLIFQQDGCAITLTQAERLRADTDRNGIIKPADAMEILQYLSGAISTFSGCSKAPISPVIADCPGG